MICFYRYESPDLFMNYDSPESYDFNNNNPNETEMESSSNISKFDVVYFTNFFL